MDKAQAIHEFWSGFGLKAYETNSVPDDATMPYITYSVATDSIGQPVPMNASIWYRSTSWKEVSEKAEEVSKRLLEMFPIRYDGGGLFIAKGNPFAQRLADKDNIKRIYINIMAEYLSAY